MESEEDQIKSRLGSYFTTLPYFFFWSMVIWINQSYSMFIRHLRIAICLPIRHKLIQIRFRMTLMTLLDSTKTCSECTAIAKTYFRFFLFHFVRQEYACMNVSILWPKLPCCLPHLVHKVLIFWEGHKILRNLHLTFVLCSASQK